MQFLFFIKTGFLLNYEETKSDSLSLSTRARWLSAFLAYEYFPFFHLSQDRCYRSYASCLKTCPYKHRQLKFIPSLVINTFLNAQLKKKKDLGKWIYSGFCFKERNLTARRLQQFLFWYSWRYIIYLVYSQSFMEKINHVEEQLLWGKSVLDFRGQNFPIRFIEANCSLSHFYPLLKAHEIPSSQRGRRIKNCSSKMRLVTCCGFDVLKCLCGNKPYWKTLNDIQQDKAVFYTLKL